LIRPTRIQETHYPRELLRTAWWGLTEAYLSLYHRLEIHGQENVPREVPFVLVSNHTSHLDTIALSSCLSWQQRKCLSPLAAGDTFFETPMRSRISSSLLNAVPVWRGHCGLHALRALREKLTSDDPCGFIMYPEGTRSRDGRMRPFKRGLGLIVAETDVPVVPCYVQGCFESFPADARIPRPRRIHVYVGEPMRFKTVPNEKKGWRRIAHEVEAAIGRMSISATGVPASA
jgi:1-acyl-sn-glycerol-3-phosphate acyltransferase